MRRQSSWLGLGLVLALAACESSAGTGGGGGNGAGGGAPSDPVPVFSKKAIFMTVGDPSPSGSPPAAEWQDALDGWTYVFFVDSDGSVTYECQHDAAEVLIKEEELGWPTGALPCVDPGGGGEGGFNEGGVGPGVGGAYIGGAGVGGADIGGAGGNGGGSPGGYSGPPGENPVPAGKGSWFGAAGGACGTWATAMCDRILGIRDPNTQVTEQEWDQITVGINGESDGSSYPDGRVGYYAARHYVATRERFDGTAEDYEKMAARSQDGCDIKLEYYRRLPGGQYDNGHIETVTSVEGGVAHTNSWGKISAVSGGSLGGFSHTNGAFPSSATVWPADSTEVIVVYVCEGSVLDELGWLILGQ
ncbi:MAG: hypothetical protein JNK04_16855 [Myxococcales bacterium]|nr:hypothetical protein [Myxococcales bacterium]